jgi:cation:H+ antiporter
MIGVSVLLLFVLADARVSRWEAALFVAGILVYTVFNLRLARRERSEEVRAEFADAVADAPRGKLWLDLMLIAGGLAVLVFGSRLLVSNSINLARLIGISEAVIGLTIVAAGTSMPELATSIIAAWRREPDIALGNVIGSNIYNILAILGVSGLLAPLHAPGIRTLDLWVMLAMAVVLLPLIWTRLAVARWEGALLVAGYCAYVYVLWPH